MGEYLEKMQKPREELYYLLFTQIVVYPLHNDIFGIYRQFVIPLPVQCEHRSVYAATEHVQ